MMILGLFRVSDSTHHRPAMPSGNRKNILEDLFSSVVSGFEKITPLES